MRGLAGGGRGEGGGGGNGSWQSKYSVACQAADGLGGGHTSVL